MPKTAEEFASLVPSGWNLDTLLELVRQNADNLIVSEDRDGELTISIGYKAREDGCLVKIR